MATLRHLTIPGRAAGPVHTNEFIYQGDNVQPPERSIYHQRDYISHAYNHSYQRPLEENLDSYQNTDEHDTSGRTPHHTQSLNSSVGGTIHTSQTELKHDFASKNSMTISWQDPALAIALFVGSILAAVGHHIYYASLENTPVYSETQQVWAIRIGTGLALLARCGLVATIGIVAAQQTWATLGQKAVSIGGIDSMFEVMGNPWAFLNKDLLLRARRLYVVAGISWILPLVAVVTPATLSVSPLVTQDHTVAKVPYYNFSNTDGWPIFGGRGYYSGVGPEVARLFTTTYTSNSFVPQPPLFPNASYDLSFWGPSYKCSNLSEIIQTKNAATWDSTSFNYTSVEAAFYGEIGPPTSPTGVLDATKTYIFKTAAPELMNNMILIGTAGFNPLWDNSDYNVRLICQLYNTSYNVNIRYDNGIQSIKENSVEYLEAQEWDGDSGMNSGFLNNGSCAPDPEANNATICPTYYMTHYIFGDFLAGRILTNAIGELLYQKGDTMLGAGSAPVFQSGLMDCPEIWNATDFHEATQLTSTFQTFNRCRGGTLAAAIEDLSRNFTYSLMTYRNWQNVATTMAPVTVSSSRNFYSYNQQTLLASYLASIIVTLGCIIIGYMALRSNGYTGSTAFSSVLLTTRNPDLDRLAENNTLGQKPLLESIRDTKLRFGMIRTRECETQPGFGLDGTVTPFEKPVPTQVRKRGTESR